MPGDLNTAPGIISLSPLALATDVTDATLGASVLRLGTRTGAGCTVTLTESFFSPQPMDPWTTGVFKLYDGIFIVDPIPRLNKKSSIKLVLDYWALVIRVRI